MGCAVSWLMLLPILILVCGVCIYLINFESRYIIKHIILRPKTIIEVERNNVSRYIQEILGEITNPEKRIEEKKSLTSYKKQRDEFIKMLPRLTKQSRATTFHVLVDKTRKLVSGKYDLIILVSSYALHFKRRTNIRSIWGDAKTSMNKNWKVFFITGGVNNPNDMKKLYKEAIKEHDIIIEDFMESYSLSMGKKVMTGLQWANANFRFDYILKTDDDVFVDVDSLISKIQKIDNRYIYMGNVMVGSEVLRSGRYGVSVEEYPAKVYEPYCSGGGYILSKPLVEKLIPIFQWEHPLRIDDAYMGGRVIKAGGKAIHEKGFLMWNDNCVYSDNLIVTHPADKECMEKLQKIVIQKKKSKI